jgi:hypothetical protein
MSHIIGPGRRRHHVIFGVRQDDNNAQNQPANNDPFAADTFDLDSQPTTTAVVADPVATVTTPTTTTALPLQPWPQLLPQARHVHSSLFSDCLSPADTSPATTDSSSTLSSISSSPDSSSTSTTSTTPDTSDVVSTTDPTTTTVSPSLYYFFINLLNNFLASVPVVLAPTSTFFQTVSTQPAVGATSASPSSTSTSAVGGATAGIIAGGIVAAILGTAGVVFALVYFLVRPTSLVFFLLCRDLYLIQRKCRRNEDEALAEEIRNRPDARRQSTILPDEPDPSVRSYNAMGSGSPRPPTMIERHLNRAPTIPTY